MGYCEIGIGVMTLAWTFIGTAVRMAQDRSLSLAPLETRRVTSDLVWLCCHGVGRVCAYVQQS